MSSPQLGSFQDRFTAGALRRRAEKVQRRRSFRREAGEVLVTQEQKINALIAIVVRGFWGRVKFFLFGR